jgi:hypothetical protein
VIATMSTGLSNHLRLSHPWEEAPFYTTMVLDSSTSPFMAE